MAKINKISKKTKFCQQCLLSKGRRCSACYYHQYSKIYYLKKMLTDPDYNRKNYQKRKLNNA